MNKKKYIILLLILFFPWNQIIELHTCGAFVQFRFAILGFAEPKSGTIALVRENSLVWTFKIKCWRNNNGQLEKRNEKWKYFLGVCGWSCKMMLLHIEAKFEKNSAKLAQSFGNYFKIKHWGRGSNHVHKIRNISFG